VHPGHEVACHVAEQLIPTWRKVNPHLLDIARTRTFDSCDGDRAQRLLVDRQTVAAKRYLRA